MWKGVPVGQVTFTAKICYCNVAPWIEICSLRDELCVDTVYAVPFPVLSIYWKHSHLWLTYSSIHYPSVIELYRFILKWWRNK